MLGLQTESVMSAARRMRDSGLIRRFGAFWDFRIFGLEGYLFGVREPKEALDGTVKWINSFGFVTHNYLRRHELNVWFTAILPGDTDAAEFADKLSARGLAYVALGAERRIKLETAFAGDDKKCHDPVAPPVAHNLLKTGSRGPSHIAMKEREHHDSNSLQKKIIALLRDELEIAPRPFTRMANILKIDEDALLAELVNLKSSGVLRRIGASIDHQRAGFSANSLMAWDFTGSERDTYEVVCDFPWVSHCYLRRIVAQNLRTPWAYNLFAMIHARDPEELDRRERILTGAFAPRKFVSMRTEGEYKKIHFSF
jgi:DNA-binding Lrp family transcriptional regulator